MKTFIIILKDGSQHEVPETNIENIKKQFNDRIKGIEVKGQKELEQAEKEAKGKKK